MGQVNAYVSEVNRYSFKDEQTGRLVSLTKLTFTNLSDSPACETDYLGSQVISANGKYELFEKFRGGKVPGFYQLSCQLYSKKTGLGMRVLDVKEVIKDKVTAGVS